MRHFASVMAALQLLALSDALAPGAMRAAGTPAQRMGAVRTRGPRLCAVEEQAETAEEEEDGPELYNVYLLNDNYNMREYVSRVLMMVTDLTESDAGDVMMQANHNGRAVVGTWEAEVAEHVCDGMTQAGLQAALQAANREEPMFPPRMDWFD